MGLFGPQDETERLLSHMKVISSLEDIREQRKMTWEQVAVALYDILDDIDAADNTCKENSEAFRGVVMKLQAKKNQYMHSPDGYKLAAARGMSIQEGLVDHAKKELELAGLFDPDSDYDGMLGTAVMELVTQFADQGHSGCSAAMTTDLFSRLASWENLTELTDNPEEWNDVSEWQNGKPGWQSTRSPSCFSDDGGKTYWDIDEDYYKTVDEDGNVWSGGMSEKEWADRPIHKSKPYGEKKDAGNISDK
jgi:hypothetical protein